MEGNKTHTIVAYLKTGELVLLGVEELLDERDLRAADEELLAVFKQELHVVAMRQLHESEDVLV